MSRATLQPGTVEAVGDGLLAGAAAWLLSGAPSTTHALVHGHNPLQAVRAAGTLVLAPEASPGRLLATGVAAHTVISFGWATVFALALPRRRTVAVALVAGLALAAVDLGLVGRRYPVIRALPIAPQVADHLAYGVLVGAVVRRRRRSRSEGDIPYRGIEVRHDLSRTG